VSSKLVASNIPCLLLNWLRSIRNEFDREMKIKAIRMANPTCALSSTSRIVDTLLSEYITIHDNCYLYKSHIGRHAYISDSSVLLRAKIGGFCSIGGRVNVGLWRHPTSEFISTYPAFFSTNNIGCRESFVCTQVFDEEPRETVVGNDVWIGRDVIIPGGVKINDGAIIAAGSVVVKDVPSFGIVGGNPARLLKYRFPQQVRELLSAISWWNWSDDKIKQFAAAGAFRNIESFTNVIGMPNITRDQLS